MDVDLFKIVGLVSALFAIGDKVYTYAQKWRESRRQSLFKKSTKSGLAPFRKVLRLTVTGDTAQAIYRFRGACPRQHYYKFYM